jgi:hypothetical protein
LIAFQGRDPDRPQVPSLHVVSADGTGLRSISPKGWNVQSPGFVPDGKWISFLGSRPVPGKFATTDHGVWRTDTKGSTPVRLTAGDIPMVSNGVSFSPSGKYLAVTLYDGSLYTVRSDGGELARLTRRTGLDPAWAATGDAIFYSGGGGSSSVIKRIGFPRVAPAMSISAPGLMDASPDWALPGQVTAPSPEDGTPPVAILGEAIDQTPDEPSRKVRAAQLPGPPMSKIPFLVMDRSGIRKIEIAAGLRVKGGCRFLLPGRKLGARRSCSQPTYVGVRNGDDWIDKTKRLPKGKYQVRFRTIDREGNAVKKPKPHVVRLR